MSLSRGVTLVQLVCCFVVRSSSSARGCSGAQRLFQVVMVAAGSAWGLALSHAGVPVHVWRCRRPFPYGGLDPLRRETSAATVAIHALGGRCSTRPCAHAIGPSSFSAVRRQAWLNCPGRRQLPRGRSAVWAETAAPVPLASTPSVGRAIGKIRWVGWGVLLFLLICIRLIPPCDWQAPVGWLYCWSFSFVFI